MSRVKKLVLVGTVSIVTIFVGLLILGIWLGDQRGAEPTFEGDPMWLWIAQLRYDDKEARKEALRALRAIGTPAITALAKDANSPNDNVRSSSAWALKRLDQTGLPKLLEALAQGDFPARKEAAEALGDLGNREAVPALIKAFDDNARSEVEEAVLTSLVSLRDERVGPALARNLAESIANDKHFDLDEMKIKAILAVGDNSASPRLIALLKHDESGVRRRAVNAIARLHDQGTAQELLKVLGDRDSDVRYEAIKELGNLGDKAAISGVILALGDQNKRVRAAAMLAVEKLRAREAIPELIRSLGDKEFRGEAIRAICFLGDRSAVPSLKELVADPNTSWYSMDGIATALVQVADETDIPTLVEIMGRQEYRFYREPDDSEPAHKLAAKALARIADSAVLSKLLDSNDIAVRYGALRALGYAGQASAFVLFEKLADEGAAFPALDKGGYRPGMGTSDVVKWLADMGPPGIPAFVHALTPRTGNASPWMGAGEKWFEKKLADPSYMQPYIAALAKAAGDANAEVRWAALHRLGWTHRKEAVPALVKALDDKVHYLVRKNAALGLGRIPHRSAYSALLKALENEDSLVRMVAADALGANGDFHAVPGLIKSLRSPDGYLLENVMRALRKITGQHFDGSPSEQYDQWQKWWKGYR